MNEQTNENTSPIINTDCMLATNFYVIQEKNFPPYFIASYVEEKAQFDTFASNTNSPHTSPRAHW